MDAEEYFAWRDRERRKHRTMTMAEYNAWCQSGDALSSPSQSNAFPGGLTIKLGRYNSYFGTTDDDFADQIINAAKAWAEAQSQCPYMVPPDQTDGQGRCCTHDENTSAMSWCEPTSCPFFVDL